MSDQQQMNGAPPPAAVMNGMTINDPLEAINALLNGVLQCAGKAANDPSAGEAKDYAAAALSMAQAATVLDPSRLAGGDTPQGRKDSLPEPPPIKDGDKDGTIGDK